MFAETLSENDEEKQEFCSGDHLMLTATQSQDVGDGKISEVEVEDTDSGEETPDDDNDDQNDFLNHEILDNDDEMKDCKSTNTAVSELVDMNNDLIGKTKSVSESEENRKTVATIYLENKKYELQLSEMKSVNEKLKKELDEVMLERNTLSKKCIELEFKNEQLRKLETTIKELQKENEQLKSNILQLSGFKDNMKCIDEDVIYCPEQNEEDTEKNKLALVLFEEILCTPQKQPEIPFDGDEENKDEERKK